VGGKLAAPVYGMMQVEALLAEDADGRPFITPDNVHLADETYWTSAPPTDIRSSIEWTGEWTVTYETFRDMGAAFMAALILIYILVVWEFGNFRIPALIMSPIPLTLLGIIPMHGIFFALGWGGEFTATSMIGWIALAGIIVRNSILLVDFAVHEIQHGATVEEAVIKSCKTRTRPILITAFALIFASSVIFFDPIFQGMAISLASGVLVSTLLTLIVIPLGCVQAADSLCEVAGIKCDDREPGKTKPAKAAGGESFLVKAWRLLVTLIIALVGLVGAIVALFRKSRKSVQKKQTAGSPAPVTRSPPVVSKPVNQEAVSDKPDVATVPATAKSKAEAPAKPKAAVSRKAAASSESVVSKKAAASTSKKKTPARKKTAEKKAVVTRKKVTKKVASKKAVTPGGREKAEAKPTTRKTAKTTPGRRGIRLKNMNDSNDDGLS